MRNTRPRWPDLFVIGAGRSGTTALHQMLGSHPSVSTSSTKSPNYFATGIPQPPWETPEAIRMARHWIGDEDTYLATFSHAGSDDLLVDVSPIYMQSTLIAPRIAAVKPEAKIVAVLRDPATRAHAHFIGRRRDGIETSTDFGSWLEKVADSPLPDETAFGHYVGCGRYAHFLAPFIESFGSDRVLIIFYEDFELDPVGQLRRLSSFADVDPELWSVDTVPTVRPNRSGEISHPAVRRLWTSSVSIRTRLRPYLPISLRRAVGHRVLHDLERSSMRPEWRAHVVELLAPDIRELSRLTGRELSSWLS